MTDTTKVEESPLAPARELAEVADVQVYLEFIRDNDEAGSVSYLEHHFSGNDEGLKKFVDEVMAIAQAEGEASDEQATDAEV